MNSYQPFLRVWNCSSFQELYLKLKFVAKNRMGLHGVPFPLSYLEHPPGNNICPEILEFIVKCNKIVRGDNSDDDAIKLIKYLEDNPPEESYEDPRLSDSQPTEDEVNLIEQIFFKGIDLPGSKHNPFGHLQYFSSFFIDMFFGNFTEFNDCIKTLSKE